MTLWDLTTNDFAFQFLICSSGNHIYRLMMRHPYKEALKNVPTSEIEEFYNDNIRSEIKMLAAYCAYGNMDMEPEYNPDIWLTAIAILIQERIDDEKAGRILKWLDYPHRTIFHTCNRIVFRMCWKRYQIRKEWVKHVW